MCIRVAMVIALSVIMNSFLSNWTKQTREDPLSLQSLFVCCLSLVFGSIQLACIQIPLPEKSIVVLERPPIAFSESIHHFLLMNGTITNIEFMNKLYQNIHSQCKIVLICRETSNSIEEDEKENKKNTAYE